ncbi:unnamed protein product, partial [Acanthocheilonema viteae]
MNGWFLDGDGWKKRWVLSEHRNDYGKFNLSYGQFFNDPDEDLGLTTTEDMKNYAISAKFPKFSNKDKILIIQYATKRFTLLDDDCGGLYIKNDELSHVYTLILYPNNTIKILADYEERIAGDLEDHYDFLKPRKIMDPNVDKPADWVDEEFISDPNDKKPDDWDQPEFILNLNVTKPDDWDEEWDGEWEPPGMVNPDFKGEWVPKEIPNPAYKGEWIHPEIDNPNYIPDPNLYLYNDIGVIGIEIWQMNSSTIYDNIIITDSIEEAKKFAALTLNGTRKGEEKMKKEFDEKLQLEENEKKKEKGKEKKEEENSSEEEEKKEETNLNQKEERKKSKPDIIQSGELKNDEENEVKKDKEEMKPNRDTDEKKKWKDD